MHNNHTRQLSWDQSPPHPLSVPSRIVITHHDFSREFKYLRSKTLSSKPIFIALALHKMDKIFILLIFYFFFFVIPKSFFFTVNYFLFPLNVTIYCIFVFSEVV